MHDYGLEGTVLLSLVLSLLWTLLMELVRTKHLEKLERKK